MTGSGRGAGVGGEGAYVEKRVPSQLQLSEVGEGCPLLRNAVQADMPVVIALLPCDAQLLQLHIQHSSQ